MAKNCETQHSHHHPFNAHTRTHMHMHTRAHKHTWYSSLLCTYFTLLGTHSLLLPLHSKTNYFGLLHVEIQNQ